MPKFTSKDIENLKTGKVGKTELRQILPDTIANSQDLQANVKTFDVHSGHYEITLIGTLDPNVMEGSRGTTPMR